MTMTTSTQVSEFSSITMLTGSQLHLSPYLNPIKMFGVFLNNIQGQATSQKNLQELEDGIEQL